MSHPLRASVSPSAAARAEPPSLSNGRTRRTQRCPGSFASPRSLSHLLPHPRPPPAAPATTSAFPPESTRGQPTALPNRPSLSPGPAHLRARAPRQPTETPGSCPGARRGWSRDRQALVAGRGRGGSRDAASCAGARGKGARPRCASPVMARAERSWARLRSRWGPGERVWLRVRRPAGRGLRVLPAASSSWVRDEARPPLAQSRPDPRSPWGRRWGVVPAVPVWVPAARRAL